MKLDSLRRIIREEVRSAIKAELTDILAEAVKVASTPTTMTAAPEAGKTSWSAPKREQASSIAEKIETKNLTPITEMLNETMNNMTGEDHNNIMGGGSAVTGGQPSMANSVARQMTGPEPGIDISQLDFLKKSKAIFEASNKPKGQLT